MKSLRQCIVLIVFSFPFIWGKNEGNTFAQRGKNGTPAPIATTVTVNEYTMLTANALAGVTQIKVNASALNTNGRFPGNLAAGDLLMIIQVQGATIRGAPWVFNTNFGFPRDSSWGGITNYNNCGNWEFAEVSAVDPDGITIYLDCPLLHSYTGTGRTEVVRVPRYNSLTINSGGAITCDPWNGTVGGICAVEVLNNTTLNGIIDVSGKGFRGGLLHSANAFGFGDYASSVANDGAEKGEGIAGWQGTLTPYGGRYAKGAPANAGGGGNGHNCGGGGGANAGDTSLWNAHGNPDISVAGYATAWNLQYAGLAASTSTGGGQGGYSFSSSGSQDPTVLPPGNASWSGDKRNPHGGYGGRPLDYSTGRLFLGGGGGAGDEDDSQGGAGGGGGGLIYLMSYGAVINGGGGQLIANGDPGGNSGRDGAGGGGGGGTIVVNSIGPISTPITMTVIGGKGGDQQLSIAYQPQAEGPGGGGGGGYITVSNGTPFRLAGGGANGVSNSNGVLPQFPPNGATKGGKGIDNATVTNFIINAANTTICAGQSATLSATLSPAQGGISIIWYDALVGGNVLPSTNGTYMTPVLSAGTYTYYVATCPGTYHQPVTVTATASPSVSAGTDATVCGGSSATLNASGGTTYSWSPVLGLNNPNVSNPVATPASTTTYVVTVSTPCGPGKDTVIVSVNSTVSANVSPSTTICPGSSATLSASGAANYLWTTGETTSAITVAPTANTGYAVTVGTGSCANTATTSVTVSSGLSTSISGNTMICPGGSATLTASGGTNYTWSSGQSINPIVVSPTTSATYSVFASSGTCKDTSAVTVNVGSNISISISGNTSVCNGNSTTLTALGGSTYIWNNGSSTAAISFTPTGTATYSVTGTSGGCSNTSSVTVNVLPSPAAAVTGLNTTICSGGIATLTATGGNTFAWSNGANSSTISVSPASTTNYTVTASNGTCTDDASITVTVLTSASAAITGNPNLCQGTTGTLTAQGGGNYLWSTGETTAVIHVNSAATYSVLVSAGTCTASATTNVTVSANPVAAVSPDIAIAQGQSVDLIASGGTTYQWSNGGSGATITVSPIVTAVYCVTVYNANNCYDTACVKVRVDLCANAGALYLPNAFSPNGDGENDELQIYYGLPQCIKDFDIVIFNRWGESVFETTNVLFKWNGTYPDWIFNHPDAGTEMYVYYMKAVLTDGSKISRKGNVSLIR